MEAELAKENFDVDLFVKKSLKQGGDETRKLRELRDQIQSLSDESSQSIRKNVFQNYMQFIETAKEISYLEGEMYQLNHLLMEQKTLMEQMMDMSFSGTKRENRTDLNRTTYPDVDERKSMQSVLEQVENPGDIPENSGRYLILESDLMELNATNARAVGTVHAFLLSDGLVLASWIPQRLGLVKYRCQHFYTIETLALVPVKDSDMVRNAFKLLIFPQHKLFACDNARLKRNWMDGVENAKKNILQAGSLIRQATIRWKKQKELTTPVQTTIAHSTAGGDSDAAAAEADWLKELPDELDVCIAQRDFDASVELLFEGKENLLECTDEVVVKEVKEKLEQKQKLLVDVLSNELRTAVDKYSGGPKAARKAITLLVKLGKSSQACDLYLKSRSGVMRNSVKELRLAEDPLSYLRQLARIVFGTLCDVAKEFTVVFASNAGCCSVLLLWASGELRTFVNLVLRHVFDPGPGLTVIGHAVRIVLENCRKLAELGLDLVFEVEKLLVPTLSKVIREHCQNLLEAIRLRITEDKWKPHNLQNEAGLHKFLEEMADLGLGLDRFVCDDPGSTAGPSERCRLWLTTQVCHFARGAVVLARDLCAVREVADLRESCDGRLLELWRLELKHVETGLRGRGKPPQQRTVAEHSARFLVGRLLPYCESEFVGSHISWTPLQDLLATDFPALVPFRPSSRVDDFEDIGHV